MTYHDGVCFPMEMRPPILVEQPEGSGTFVRLSEDVRTSVVCLGYVGDSEGEIGVRGTGFLVKGGDPRSRYLVTAGHVALQLGEDPFCVRLNQSRNGPGRLHHIDRAQWFYHPDATVDLAVMLFQAPEWADVVCWPLGSALSEFKLATKNIGGGDFSYVVGVLPFKSGKKRNMPAVHTGHVVLMDDGEKLPIIDWRSEILNPTAPTEYVETDAYLVQATALPGSSGSPVFVRRSLETKLLLPEIDPKPIKVSIPGSLWLLGIWTGAWFGKAPKPSGLSDYTTVPFGVGMVVPATKLAEVIDQKEFVDMRKAAQNAKLAKLAPTPLSASSTRGIEKAGDAILRAALNAPPARQQKPKATSAKRGRSAVSSK